MPELDPQHRTALLAKAPEVQALNLSTPQWNAFADVPAGTVEAFIALDGQFLPDLDTAVLKATPGGKLASMLADAAEVAMLQKLLAAVRSGEIDPSEYETYFKPIHRTKAESNRVRLAEKDPYADLPTIHYTVINNVHTTTVLDPGALPMADVVEADTSEPSAIETQPTPALEIDWLEGVEPLPLDEEPSL